MLDASVQARRTGALRLLVVIGLGLAACDQPPLEPVAAGPDLMPRFLTTAPVYPFSVAVTAGGQPVEGAIFRLTHSTGFTITSGKTDAAGVATVNAPRADYCVTVRVVPVSIMAEPVVAPAVIPPTLAGELSGLRKNLAPVTVDRFGNGVAFSPAVFQDCLANGPTKHSGNSTSLSVALPEAARYTLPLRGPDGQSLFAGNPGLQQIVGYAVTPVQTRHLAPEYMFSNDGAFFDGFLQSVSGQSRPADASAVVNLEFGVAPGSPVQIEYQQSVTQGGRTINFTATLKEFMAGAAGPHTLDALIAEPLYCSQHDVAFPGYTRFFSANFGYMADANPAIDANSTDLRTLLVSNLTVVPLELVVRLNESYTVSFREDPTSGGRTTSELSFACGADSCQRTGTKSPGGSGHVHFDFYRKLDANTAKATIFLTGVRNSSSVSWQAKASSNEAVPPASKSNTTSAFIAVPKPSSTTCLVQDSNDDKFFLGRG